LSWHNGKTEIAEYLAPKGHQAALHRRGQIKGSTKRSSSSFMSLNSVDLQAPEIVLAACPSPFMWPRIGRVSVDGALHHRHSAEPMNVPSGEEKLRHAELTIQRARLATGHTQCV
jgi:hypothetical protein